MNNIYLDNAASMPLSRSVKECIASISDIFGNPSSLHNAGEQARRIIEDARKSAARFINAEPDNIIFTGSGSASNTLAVKGFMDKHSCTLLYSPTAHKSIIKCAEAYSQKHTLKVDKDGFINIHDLKDRLKTLRDKAFVVIEYANSEIGTIQNVTEIVRSVHRYNGVIFIDCTGSVSTIPIDMKKINADMTAFSGHKIGGLKGCGVLYKKSDISLAPLIYGTQEYGLFGGTENVFGIASLGTAADNYDYSEITSKSRDYVYNYAINNISDCYLVGASLESGNRLSHNLYICFQRIEGESLMMLLDMNGVQVSTGSACNSRDITASSVLTAVKMNKNDIHSCIRMSFGGQETKEELDYVCRTLKYCVDSLRQFNNKKIKTL